MTDMSNSWPTNGDADVSGSEAQTECTTEKKRPYFKLSRGWVKQQLCTELAKGEATLQELANKYGCAVSSVHEFKTRNIVTIEALRADMQNEMAGLWIAEKRNRVAEYQADVDLVNEALDEIPASAMAARSGRGETSQHDGLFATKHRALKSVAEELGQLPNRVSISGEVGTTVTYSVEGVDMEDLR